jgi:hypothetical protein
MASERPTADRLPENEIWCGWDDALSGFMAIMRTPGGCTVGIGPTEIEAHENLIAVLNRPEAFRRVEKREEDRWIPWPYEFLQVGDEFRAFEPTGEPVDDGKIYRVTRLARPVEPRGNVEIIVEPVTEEGLKDRARSERR